MTAAPRLLKIPSASQDAPNGNCETGALEESADLDLRDLSTVTIRRSFIYDNTGYPFRDNEPI